MKQHPPGRGDWLFIAALIGAFALVFWALFGALIAKALGWNP